MNPNDYYNPQNVPIKKQEEDKDTLIAQLRQQVADLEEKLKSLRDSDIATGSCEPAAITDPDRKNPQSFLKP